MDIGQKSGRMVNLWFISSHTKNIQIITEEGEWIGSKQAQLIPYTVDKVGIIQWLGCITDMLTGLKTFKKNF